MAGLTDIVDAIAADFADSGVTCLIQYGPDHVAEHAEPMRIVVSPTSDTYGPAQYVQQNAWPSGTMADGQNPRPILTREEGARAIIWAAGTLDSLQFTVNHTTGVFTANGHGFANAHAVQVSNTGGALPAGLAAQTTYIVSNVTANTFKLVGVTMTTDGTGVNTVSDAPSYQQRADYDALHLLINQFILSLHRVNPGNYKVRSGTTLETTRVDRLGYVYELQFSVECPIIDAPWPTETGVEQDSTVKLIRPDGSTIEAVEIN